MTDTQSATPKSQTTIDDARALSRRSFIAALKANRDVFSNLPERIEQWLEKETRATNQPGTTEHGYVRPRWRMIQTNIRVYYAHILPQICIYLQV